MLSRLSYAPFSGFPPARAGDRNRTCNQLITNQPRFQLRHAGMAFVSGLSPVLDFGLSTDLRSSASFFDFTRRLTGTLRASLFTNTSVERRDLNPHIRLFKADAHTHALRSKDERIFSAQWNRRESNPQPPACKAGAPPIELRPRMKLLKQATGFEPAFPPRQGGALPIAPRLRRRRRKRLFSFASD